MLCEHERGACNRAVAAFDSKRAHLGNARKLIARASVRNCVKRADRAFYPVKLRQISKVGGDPSSGRDFKEARENLWERKIDNGIDHVRTSAERQ